MRKFRALLFAVFILFSLSTLSFSKSNDKDETENEQIEYSDSEINIITNIVNGEVGGICGYVVITYHDGTSYEIDGDYLRMIHARVVDNQVKSDLFPNSISGCAKQCWSKSYANTSYRTSNQWQNCRQLAIDALSGEIDVPSNVYAATCDPYFASKYSSFSLWAKVYWNTGWVKGTFYYYMYGNEELWLGKEKIEENDTDAEIVEKKLPKANIMKTEDYAIVAMTS